MIERTNNPEILEGARLLEISCIRMAEYLKYTAYSEAKHQTWRTEE